MSSPVVLSLSTVFALVGIVLVAIAFGTNSWQIYKVDRQRLFGAYESNGTVRQYFEKLMLKDFESVDLTVDRWFGLFRECFEQKLPKGTFILTFRRIIISPLFHFFITVMS